MKASGIPSETVPKIHAKPSRFDWRTHAGIVTGTMIGEDSWLKSQSERQRLERQTEEIAFRLEAAGIETKRDCDLTLIGVCSGLHRKITSWRHINFLPSVASANRHQTLRRLSYFAEKHKYLRYLVITNGSRCGINQLRERMQDLAREISRFSALSEVRTLGISVQLRVSEITAQRDDDGTISYHPHANVIIDCQRFTDWKHFLEIANRHFTGHWRDNGRLIDAAEAVKYFIKPAELENHSPEELKDLFYATESLRLCTPMGNFKELGAKLKADGFKIAKIINREDGNWKFCMVKKNGSSKAAENSTPKENAVMAKISPAPAFTRTFEPLLMVRNFKGDIDRVLKMNRLDGYFSEMRLKYAAAVIPAIRFTPAPQLTGDKPRDYEIKPWSRSEAEKNSEPKCPVPI